MIHKTLWLMLSIFFSITILAACTKTTEVATLPPPMDTQMPPTPTLEIGMTHQLL